MLIFYYLVFSQKRPKSPEHFWFFFAWIWCYKISIEFLREPDSFFKINENPKYAIEFFRIGISIITAHSSMILWTFNDPFSD